MSYLNVVWKDSFNWRNSWSKTELGWLIAALAIVGVGSINATALEFLAALTNVVCVIMVAKGRVGNYVWGLAGVLLYAIVSYNAQLYANFTLNIIFIPLQFIGSYYWVKDLEEKKDSTVDVSVRPLSALALVCYFSVGIAAWALVALTLEKYTDDPSPMLDSFCLVASLIAMWFMVKQYAAQWILWIIINIVTIYLWVLPALDQPGSWAQVAQWTVLLGNSFYGAYKWFWVRKNK